MTRTIHAPLTLALLLTALLLPTTAFADEPGESEAHAGLALGYRFDLEEPSLGLDGRFFYQLNERIALGVQLQAHYYLIGSTEILGATARTTALQFDLNLLAQLNLDTLIEPYAGIGPALVYSANRISDSSNNTLSSSSDTDMGFNLVLGTSLDLDDFSPFVQFRATFQQETASAAILGLTYEFD